MSLFPLSLEFPQVVDPAVIGVEECEAEQLARELLGELWLLSAESVFEAVDFPQLVILIALVNGVPQVCFGFRE